MVSGRSYRAALCVQFALASVARNMQSSHPVESSHPLVDANSNPTDAPTQTQTNSQKRHVRFQEQDGSIGGPNRLPGSRPSSAPAEPNAKAAKKAYKKMEKEQR